ncbi:MAG TPA: hypothetical protein VFA59_24805 [Vicinamibacterales bacterium]|nr:hypothetical protein [Vicinamibacterales bacterium]
MASVQRRKMSIAITLAVLVVTVTPQTPAVTPTLVAHVIEEVDAIWKPAGLSIVWNRQPVVEPSLHVTIGPARGSASARDSVEPLGWILFESNRPQPNIYVSLANATELLQNSRGVVGHSSGMPIVEREAYLSRAMGRALAHEIGHYLLASRDHSRSGLMKATRTAAEFFAIDRVRFELSTTERAIVEERMSGLRLADAAAAAGRKRATAQH